LISTQHQSGFSESIGLRLPLEKAVSNEARTSARPSLVVAKHNRGEVGHTAKFMPWRIETAVAFLSRDKAAAFELYLKSGSGRAFARRHF